MWDHVWVPELKMWDFFGFRGQIHAPATGHWLADVGLRRGTRR